MTDYGMDIVSLFGEKDAKRIAIMYVEMFLDIGNMDFAQNADGIIDTIREMETDRIKEWTKGEGAESK